MDNLSKKMVRNRALSRSLSLQSKSTSYQSLQNEGAIITGTGLTGEVPGKGRGRFQANSKLCSRVWYFSVWCLWCSDPMRVMASSFLRILDHTQWCTTVGRTPLDEWLAHRRDFYLTTHNTHSRQTSMPLLGFEPTISAGKWPQTYALDCAATGTGDGYRNSGVKQWEISTKMMNGEVYWCIGPNVYYVYYFCNRNMN